MMGGPERSVSGTTVRPPAYGGFVFCASCGFDYESVAPDAIAEALRPYPASFRECLEAVEPERTVRRPAPAVWSALEYACHVRDVLLAQRERAVRALVEDQPTLPPMHRDERVKLCGYGLQEPAVVLGQLAMADQLLVLLFDQLSGDDWSRTVVYNWPQPQVRDLVWVGRHTVHECRHHLGDITLALA